MELKRILAKDSRSASEEAISKYGRDVLIISSNRVNGQTELIVAVDVQERAKAAPASPTPTRAFAEPAVESTLDDEPESNPFEELLFARQHEAPKPRQQPPEPQSSITTASTALASQEQQLATQYDTLRGSEIVALLKEELSAIRQEIRLHQQLGMGPLDALPPSLQPLMDELVERGMPPGLREHMTRVWKTMDDPIEALGALETELTRLLPPSQAPIQLEGVHVLVGPSGAGKSLACAKLAHLAADALGSEHVAWISFADHRAGAWSQTQMLATSAGVATFRAGNAEGLKLLLTELAHLKLVLIDTAGVDFEQQLQNVMNIAPHAQTHMVLPIDATLTSIKRALRHTHELSSVILSKLDESYSPWAMIYGLNKQQTRVAWINDSERLHAPMQAYTPQALAEKALNTLGQVDDPDESEHNAKALRLNEMHEVPDLAPTLEPFNDEDEEDESPSHTRILTLDDSPDITAQYVTPQFGRAPLIG